MCHALNIFRHPTFYQEIATGLKALAMTVVVFARLRRFEQSDKLKFELLFCKKRQPKLPFLCYAMEKFWAVTRASLK